jgi:DNA-binding IclR family transcriptional regulator
MGVTAIGQDVGLHKSTVHRLLGHLVSQGYIEKDEARPVYTLGLKFIELASLRLNQVELKTEAGPYLRRLAVRFDQPVHLAILVDTEAVYLEKIEPQAHLRMYSQIGKRIPVYCSALGKALVSDWTPLDLEALVRRLDYQPFTAKTLRTPEQLLADIAAVRTRGWAVDDEEHEPGIVCVAAPIRDFTGRTVAAVSASGLSRIIRPEPPVTEEVTKTAEAISRRLGWLGPAPSQCASGPQQRPDPDRSTLPSD